MTDPTPAPVATPLVRIVIADDHRMVREALRQLLEAEPEFQVVGEANDGIQAIALTRELAPDILLLDFAMPGLNGIEALAQLAAARPHTRVIMLTAAIEKAEMVRALHLGARGFVLKESGASLLLKAIRGVNAGEYWVGREWISDLLDGVVESGTVAPPEAAKQEFGLTVREREIIAAVMNACTNKEIAEIFTISEKTVKHHLTNIFTKVGVSNRLELALFVAHHNLDLPVLTPSS